MKNSVLSRLLSGVLPVCVAGLALGATYAFRRNCESFGCPNAMGLWSAWIVVYVVVGATGLRLRRALVPGTRSRKIVSTSLAMLALLGALLASYWFMTDAA